MGVKDKEERTTDMKVRHKKSAVTAATVTAQIRAPEGASTQPHCTALLSLRQDLVPFPRTGQGGRPQ